MPNKRKTKKRETEITKNEAGKTQRMTPPARRKCAQRQADDKDRRIDTSTAAVGDSLELPEARVSGTGVFLSASRANPKCALGACS
jgi:hypothetical protein